MAGGQGAQILQQVEGLLTQLAQSEPEPEVQQAIQGILQQVQPLMQLVGKDDMQDMQSGLNNPSGPPPGEEGGEMPGGAGGQELPSGGGAEGAPSPGGGDEGATHHVEIHITPAKTFAGARKQAMATHAQRGHFSQHTPAGERPSTDRTKNKAKG
jgi:hypothetical protein